MEQKIHDKTFEIFIPSEQIADRVRSVAEAINHDYASHQPLFISVLNGAFMFTSDLIKYLRFFPEVSFIKFASYSGMASTGNIKQLIGLNEDLQGRDVVIVEDIIDTGLTMEQIITQVKAKKPKSVRVATLLFKPEPFKGDFKIDYVGFEIPNKFVVGYGMDYNGIGRNLPDIYQHKL